MLRILDSNVINQGTILIWQGQNEENWLSYREYNESDISLDFHVVFGMERPNVLISFISSKVGFHLTWLKYKKEKEHKEIYFIFIKIITSSYIRTNMDTYQHKEVRFTEVFKHYLSRILENISLVKISI